ncbi:hypothetical protein L596_010101 [Steinernema carpocapsae]|uniref:G-protein coupled receptors family 1 profile domain-containing protein n=1 Tax=Steinernema carpocapsae TaxID=34508 RepID=A0A4U5PHB6_STECR|nr:hypothetical protein L596_010101 [Steinernema carpocapsae]
MESEAATEASAHRSFSQLFLTGRLLNAVLACVLGVLLNIVVLVGVIRVSTCQLKSYRYIVGCVTAVDLIFALLAGLVFPGFDFDNGFLTMITGPITLIGSPELSRLFFIAHNLIYNAYFLLQPVTFVCRYFIICRPKIATYLNTRPVLYGSIIMTCIYGIGQAYFIGMLNQVVRTPHVTYMNSDTNETIFTSAHYLNQQGADPVFVQIKIAMYMVLVVSVFFVMFFCSFKIFFYLRRNANHFSARTIEAHKKLTLALVLQAVFPILTGVVPSIVCLYLFFTAKGKSILEIKCEKWLFS